MDVSSGGEKIKIGGLDIKSFPYSLELDGEADLTIEAVPKFGYVFDGWSGDLTGNANPASLYVDCDHAITANFSIDWRLYGLFIGCGVLVIFFVSVLIIRRKA